MKALFIVMGFFAGLGSSAYATDKCGTITSFSVPKHDVQVILADGTSVKALTPFITENDLALLTSATAGNLTVCFTDKDTYGQPLKNGYFRILSISK